jgi:hypothetical protein
MTTTVPVRKLSHYAETPLFTSLFDEVNLKITVLLNSKTGKTRVGYKVENARSYDCMLASESWLVSDIHDPEQFAEACHDALRAALAFLQTFPAD